MNLTLGYSRQSHKKSDKESSITWQQAVIDQAANSHDVKIDKHFFDIKSGKNGDRPQFQELTKLISGGDVKHLYVYRLDRLYRHTTSLLEFLELLSKKNVTVHSTTEGHFDYSTPRDRIKMQTLAIVGELQRTVTKENRELGNLRKFKDGKPVNYMAPFGYRYKDREFKIHEKEAETVAFIFQQYIAGHGYKKIAQSTEKHPNLISRKPWQVRNIIVNPKNKGVFSSKHGTLHDVIPPIISKETYEEAQKSRAARASARKKRSQVDAKLRRKIICPYCHSKLTTYHYRAQPSSQPFYVCQKRLKEQYTGCSMTSIPLRGFENRVLQEIVQFLKAKNQLESLHKRALDKIMEKQKQENAGIRHYDQSKERLIDRLAGGKISLDDFKLQMEGLEEMKNQSKKYLLPKITPQRISKLITMNADLHEALWPLIEHVKIDENANITDISLVGFNINIIKYNNKELKINE